MIRIETYYLQKITDDDFDLYYRLAGDKKVMAMITEQPLPVEEARAGFAQLVLNNQVHPRFGSYKIVEATSGEFVGLAKIRVNHPTDRQAEIGYMLLPQFWGKGIGGKVVKELIEYCRAEQLEQLYAIIDPNNIPSRRILTKNGFVSAELMDYAGLPGERLVLDL